MQRTGVDHFPSLAPIKMTDKRLQCSSELTANYVNEEASENVTKNDKEKASNKCNQCKYASSQVGNLRKHMKKHSGEKTNKCSQCDFASSYTRALRAHLKIHSGEKPNKCNQCDFASSQAGHLRTHMQNPDWRKGKQMQPV